MTLAEIREKRAAKVAEMRALLTKAETEKRGLTDAEKATFDAIKSEVQTLEGDEQRAAFMQEAERRAVGQPVDAAHANLERRVSVLDVIRAQVEGRSLAGAAAEYHQEAERRTNRKAQGIFVPLTALEQRVNTTASAEQLVPTDHRADQYIEPFRNALLARRLGVRVLSGLSGNVVIPKFGTGTTTGWVAENSALTPSGMAFAAVNLAPKHAGGMTEMSRQLIQQSAPAIEELVRGDLSFMLAQAIDSALIKGGGANEPKGVLSTSGIQTGSLGTLAWVNVSAMIGQLEAVNANAAGSAWLMAPTAAGAFRTTLKSASAGAEYLLQKGQIGDLPAHVTNQVPTTGGATPKNIAILGDWSQVLLGIWSELDVLVNPFAETAYSKGNVLVRAMATVDIGLRHPEAFVVAQDLG